MKKLTSLCLSLLACASAAQASSKHASMPAPGCDRECLRGMITESLYSLLKHDTSALPLGEKVRITEDAVEKKLDKALRAAGLESVNPVNERFDPALHEAVGTETADSPDLDGTVARVYQLGYTFKGQLLRPARVVVRQHHD